MPLVQMEVSAFPSTATSAAPEAIQATRVACSAPVFAVEMAS